MIGLQPDASTARSDNHKLSDNDAPSPASPPAVGSAARILAAPALFEQVVEGAGNVRAGGPWFCATEVDPFHQLISLPNRAQQPRAGAIDFGRPSTSADERSMAQMLPFIVPPTALPLAAHRVSFLLLPARLELGSRRCSLGLEEDDKTTEL